MGCKGAIEKKLNATNGISDFHIVFEDSTATVRFDSTLITVDKIIAEVADVAGGGFYTATLLDI
jgi:copper chaperone CopZ